MKMNGSSTWNRTFAFIVQNLVASCLLWSPLVASTLSSTITSNELTNMNSNTPNGDVVASRRNSGHIRRRMIQTYKDDTNDKLLYKNDETEKEENIFFRHLKKTNKSEHLTRVVEVETVPPSSFNTETERKSKTTSPTTTTTDDNNDNEDNVTTAYDDVEMKSKDVGSKHAESSTSHSSSTTTIAHPPPPGHLLRLAFVGNSILYFNDSPQLVQLMLNAGGYGAVHDSCLIGGSTLISLFFGSCGLREAFGPYDKLNINETDGTSYYEPGPNTLESLLLPQSQPQPDVNEGSTDTATSSSTTSARTAYEGYDFVIMNDNTQGPARISTRAQNVEVIQRKYAPLLQIAGRITPSTATRNTAIPILIQTPAYRIPGVQQSTDLGDFYEFTTLLRDGIKEYETTFNDVFSVNKNEVTIMPYNPDDDFYNSYRDVNSINNDNDENENNFEDELYKDENENNFEDELYNDMQDKSDTATITDSHIDLVSGTDENLEENTQTNVRARIAPVGEAYVYLYENNDPLFQKLYTYDSYHPSPHGTYLQACILYITIVGTIPPPYDGQWWTQARFMSTDSNPNDTGNNNHNNNHNDGFISESNLPILPTTKEANELLKVALFVTGLIDSSEIVWSETVNIYQPPQHEQKRTNKRSGDGD